VKNEATVWIPSVGDLRRARAEVTFIAILLEMMVRPGRPHAAMKAGTSSLFAAHIHFIVILIALGFSFVGSARARGDDHSRAELNRQIGELNRQGKYKEAIPLAVKLVDLGKRAKGNEDPETAQNLNHLADLYADIRDFTKAESLYQEALEICLKVLGREHPIQRQACTVSQNIFSEQVQDC
jgi:tetratricopeptide (TPR) repeat protein